MANILIIDRNIATAIVKSLKQIKPADYESMDILVGCVTMLQAELKEMPAEKEEESSVEGGEITNE